MIACEFPSSLLTEWIDAGHPFSAELARIRDVEYVDLPTGHWPQFTRPVALGQAILAAVERAGRAGGVPVGHTGTWLHGLVDAAVVENASKAKKTATTSIGFCRMFLTGPTDGLTVATN